jgi:hypothetical protein
MSMRRHDALPITDTMVRECDRSPVDGNTPADYPLLARCESCHREIRIEAALGSGGWKHTAAPRPPRDRPDEIAKLEEFRDLYADLAERLANRTPLAPVTELPTRRPQASGHKPPVDL